MTACLSKESARWTFMSDAHALCESDKLPTGEKSHRTRNRFLPDLRSVDLNAHDLASWVHIAFAPAFSWCKSPASPRGELLGACFNRPLAPRTAVNSAPTLVETNRSESLETATCFSDADTGATGVADQTDGSGRTKHVHQNQHERGNDTHPHVVVDF